VALLHTVFSRFDTSGDGEMTQDEFKRTLRQMGRNFSDAQVADLVHRIDSDNSGTINIKEFLVAVQHKIF
jgi:Ca2+-binding EF-hand superfamily protein